MSSLPPVLRCIAIASFPFRVGTKDVRAPAVIDSLSRKFFITGIEDNATRATALRALFAANLC
ncbi:MAG: hypothetical protein ABGZ49_08325 [Akkermansiaceae bacterium]